MTHEEIPREVRAEAIKALERWSKNKSARLQIEALIGSLGDTLSAEVILSELGAMNAANRFPFVEVFASVK